MHYLLLVVGPSHHQQLEPYADYRKVEPYRVYLEPDELESMAEHFRLPADDLEALAAKMPEWNEVEGEIHQGRLSFWSRENPDARYDFYKVGGRFSGYLRLKEPRRPSWLGRLLGRKATDRVDRATKGEVLIEAVLDDPPAGLVANGVWIEQGWGDNAPSDHEWKQQFAERFRLIADDELLTVVDVHF